MTDNELKTRPVPHQSAADENQPQEPREAGAVLTDPGFPPPPASFEVMGGGTPEGAPGKRSMMDRIRTPVAAAVGGGILVLGAGFGAGFAVGHGMGGGQSVQTGPGGQGGFGGQGFGGMGGPGGQTQGGTGQSGTGQSGTGQFGPGQSGTGQSGTGQSGTVPGQSGTNDGTNDGTSDGTTGATTSDTGITT